MKLSDRPPETVSQQPLGDLSGGRDIRAGSGDTVRRDALIEAAAMLRRRGETKRETDPFAAMECENCALVIERLAGVPT